MSSADQEGRTGVVIVGSLNADITVSTSRLPRPGETVRGSNAAILPGGKGANQAVAAARLGARVSLIGAVGDDSNGAMLIAAARDAGVATDRIRTVAGVATGLAFVTVDDRGENTIVISPGANAKIDRSDVQANIGALRSGTVLGLSLEVDIDVVTEAARIAHTAGTTVLTNLSPFADEVGSLLEVTDVLLVNEHEAAQLVGKPDITDQSVAAALLARGISRAIVTLGSDGCMVIDGATPVAHVPAVPVRVVDTTGCGDAFMGAVCAQLSDGASLLDAARFGASVAGYAAQARGAQPSYPNRRDLENEALRRRAECGSVKV
ncbi:ribokinase [Raineyella sp. LH-20]|uniref:ribokinase n=1 Tax=Raineyella sp. LH-20 TaxID=3081204 RepID=UPI0029551F11|nr:ribokinase [Raineyella sp. LH-20]WOP18655.1 ribokinase [Raineyella sp. LH-20]